MHQVIQVGTVSHFSPVVACPFLLHPTTDVIPGIFLLRCMRGLTAPSDAQLDFE